jgi:uncharacterized protein (DUF302 family)
VGGTRAPARTLASLLWLVAAACLASDEPPANGEVYRARTTKPYADVIYDVEFAITERNFRLTGKNAVGKGLRERGYADFPEVDVIHFCSLERAREVLLLDPDYGVLMPCRVAVRQDGPEVVVSGILLPERHPDPRVVAFAREMNAIMRAIVDYAVAAD